MRSRAVHHALVLLFVAACAEPGTMPSDAVSPSFAVGSSVDHSAKAMDIAVIGDVPYGAAAFASFPRFIDAINADSKVRLVLHVGDIKSGSTVCSDAWATSIRHAVDRFKDPMIYAIGDNEWTDCHRANNGGYEPLGRLAGIRATFFDRPGTSLGGREKSVDTPPGFPELQYWMESRVAFAAFHIIGSNNGLNKWFGAAESAGQGAARVAEYTARNAANLAWLERTFQEATQENAAGVVLMVHADLWHPEDRQAGAAFDGHTAFVTRLSDLAAAFGRPVLILSGDSHDYRVDGGVPWFSLYGATPQANVTQVIVDNSIEDTAVWLRLHVDPKSSTVFSWEEVTAF